jgi:peptide/nickel transport system substrate-binding protein
MDVFCRTGRMMRRRTFLAGSAALATPHIARAQVPRVLRFIPQADLAVLDPIWTSAYITREHAGLVFDTLYGMDADFVARPQMAAGHRIERDGLEWQITLREGLRFHDGEPVRAQDVVPSLIRWGRRDPFGGVLMDNVDELSAVSDRMVRFRLKHPFSLLPDALGKSGANIACIMPERLAITDPMTRLTEMVGSGPFRFLATEWMQGAHVAYERFDGYVPRPDGTPSFMAGPRIAYFDRVEWHIIPDGATAAAALQAGEIDWWERPTPDMLPLLTRDPKLAATILDDSGALQFMRFNHLYPPFDNAAIRRAMLGAFSQTDVMTAAGGTDSHMWNNRCGAFPPGMPMASTAGLYVLTGPRDLDRVKRDLADAGYRGEKVVMLGIADVPELQAISEVTADSIRRAGMNLDLQMLDWGSVVQRRNSTAPAEKGGWNVMHSGLSGTDMANPITNLVLRGNGRDAWFGWPTAPALETLRTAWIQAGDTASQKAIAEKMQLQLWQDVPYIPLGVIKRATVYRRDLTDILIGGVVFTNVRRRS